MSAPVRVPDEVHREVQAVAQLFGCSPGALLERAWEAYQANPRFKEDFELAQKAVQVGDVALLADHYRGRRHERAESKVAKLARSRSTQAPTSSE